MLWQTWQHSCDHGGRGRLSGRQCKSLCGVVHIGNCLSVGLYMIAIVCWSALQAKAGDVVLVILIVAVTFTSLFLAEKGSDFLSCWASSSCTKYLDSSLPTVHRDYIPLKLNSSLHGSCLGFAVFHMQSYVVHSSLVLLPSFLLLAAFSSHLSPIHYRKCCAHWL